MTFSFLHIIISIVKVLCSNQLDRDCSLAELGHFVFELFFFEQVFDPPDPDQR